MAKPAPHVETLLKRGADLYKEHFGDYPTIAASAPGRVNLIGEHIDYNDGYVLPMALSYVTLMVGRANDSSEICVFTEADVGKESQSVRFGLPKNQKLVPGDPKWANYVKGVIQYFQGEVPGFNAVIVSSVPMGGGLASSAALEVTTYTFLEALTGYNESSSIDKAYICQKAEHDFANVPCGIMDQCISILGKPETALFLDCRSQSFSYVPFNRPDAVLLITHSNVRHYLNSTNEYAERKSKCVEAAKLLGVKSLREASPALLEANEHKFDPLTFRRARHVISEIERTSEGARALANEDYDTFGKLMVGSHKSLRDDYNVSCREVDELVEISLKCDGVFGARMTGAGFGGCTITLLRSSHLNDLIKKIEADYSGKATFFLATASPGSQDVTPLLNQVVH